VDEHDPTLQPAPGPGQLDAVDLAALADTGPLLRYVSEHCDALDPELPLTIAKTREAASAGAWPPEVAQEFWVAYAKLCQLVRPATVDTIKAVQPSLKVRRWFGLFGDVRWMSPAQRTAEQYIGVLIATLLAVLTVQLYTSGIDSGSRELAATAQPAGDMRSNIAQQNSLLSAQTQGIKVELWTQQQRQSANLLRDQALKLTAASISACQTAVHLRLWLGPILAGSTSASPCPARETPSPDSQWWDEVDTAQAAWATASDYIARVQLRAQVVYSILNKFVLPVLLGLTGAVVYVIRSISDQIKTTTFASISPLRHKIRVWLGPLMGMIAGMFAQIIQLPANLSPLALAFLAGYAVKAMFSLFDNTIASANRPAKTPT
jgi:hypothetical protein